MGLTRRSCLAAPALALAACRSPRGIEGGFIGVSHERGHRLREPAAWPAPAATRRVHTVIAGAGVAGLAAARALRQRGIEDFVVLELEDEAGGNSRSAHVAGLPCPMGAHYLPVPGDDATEVQDLLEELGLRRRVAGRWTYDERHLCHSPQERLYFQGHWQEGLLPLQGVGAGTLAQYRRFAARVAALRRSDRFALPAPRARWTATHAALDAEPFAAWLAREGLDDAHLRWYLDYCCRDEYGAGLATVSAWAGLHYFASRHGFAAPGEAEAADEREAVLTWPEGNGWLTQRLAAPLGHRLRAAHLVLRIADGRHGAEVDVLDLRAGTVTRWACERVVVALPVNVAARVVAQPPALLTETARRLRQAPWLLAHIAIDAPLRDRPGAAPSWDNVLYGARGLGYVDASHQSLRPVPGATVLSYYRALGDDPQGRARLLAQPWSAWRDEVMAELLPAHPDLPERATRIDIVRHGHAMAMPVPGLQGWLRQAGVSASAPLPVPRSGRLAFAHADWAGYSVFEEAFARGHAAGMG
jgi:monoamine oxidase